DTIYYGKLSSHFGTLLIYVVLQPNSNLDGSHLKVICITASNTWGLFLLVLLEGYGLVEIPRKLWNTTKKGYMLNFLYFKASKVSAERCEAEEKIDDLMEEITHISNTTPASHPTRPYVDLILEKLPDERKSVTQLRRSRDDGRFSIDGISVKGLAKLHKQIIRAIHMYRRTQCQWNMLLEQVFHWEDVLANETNREKIFKTSVKTTKSPFLKFIQTPKIEWYWNCMLRNWVYRTLCVVLSVFSAIVVWSELTFFTQSPTLSIFALFIKSAKANYNYIAIETRILKRDRRAILPQIAADFNEGASTSVSVRTVQRTVINMGSLSRRSTRVPLLTALYKALLLSWARQHYHWTVDDWKHVTWSDKSCFQLYRTGARVRVWRQHR
ncbi:LMBR1 domain-containing protein 2, partial [Araneus ventricosus]